MLVRSGGSLELKRVANFTVMHKAWGSVRWLEPVDVRSLPLKEIVQIAHKNVDVSTLHTVLLDCDRFHHSVDSQSTVLLNMAMCSCFMVWHLRCCILLCGFKCW